MHSLIEFQNVTLGYRRRVVLRDLTFAIRTGEFFGIVGANGSGKTTILRVLLGILAPRQGRIVRPPAAGPWHCGYVPQRGFLDEIYPLTAGEIVMMGRAAALGLFARARARDHALIRRSLEATGIGTLADRLYRDLSGGQKQRVLIARALAGEARVLVLDEPTDGMDLEGQAGIVGLVKRLQTDHGVTVVYVTHRLNELAGVADRLLLLHEGAVRLGPVDEILTAPVLSAVYGIDVRVEQVDGKRVVLT